MRHPVQQGFSSRSRRLSGVVWLAVLFGVFFVAPLYAAVEFCTMPCCKEAKAATITSTNMAACETECSISAAKTAPSNPVSLPQQSRSSLAAPDAFTISLSPISPNAVDSHELAPAHAHAPLHLLNSTFRI